MANEGIDKLTRKALEDYLEGTLQEDGTRAEDGARHIDGGMWDVAVPINRTNAVPLDNSAIVFPVTKEDGKLQTAEEAAVAATNDTTAYPGQLLTVVEDNNVTGFIVQPNSHIRFGLSLDEDNNASEDDQQTTVEQIAFKSQVDLLDKELRHEIGNLTQVMNFRGAFESFAQAQAHAESVTVDLSTGQGVALKPGDVIVITGSPEVGTKADGKPGMEYVYIGYDEVNDKHNWAELGFGSQVVTFLGGEAGLSIPTTLPDKSTTPDSIKTVLGYIQKSDKTITDFIGGATTENLPKQLPYSSDTYTSETVIKYVIDADNAICNELNGVLAAEVSARKQTDTDLAEFIGTNIAIDKSGKATDLAVPEKLSNETDTPKEVATVFDYVKHSDIAISNLIGAKTETDLPEKLVDGATPRTSKTVLGYIQEEVSKEKEYRENADKDLTDRLTAHIEAYSAKVKALEEADAKTDNDLAKHKEAYAAKVLELEAADAATNEALAAHKTAYATKVQALEAADTTLQNTLNKNVEDLTSAMQDADAELTERLDNLVLDTETVLMAKDLRFTMNFGRYTTSNNKPYTISKYKNGADETDGIKSLHDLFIDAFSLVLYPTTNYPTASFSANGHTTDTGTNEIGSYVKAIKWKSSSGNGSYVGADGTGTYGSSGGTSDASGISSSNFSWAVSNNKDTQTSTGANGTFTFTETTYKDSTKGLQINSTSSKTYATLDCITTLDPSKAYTPKDNTGELYEAGKIKGFDTAGTTTKTFKNVAINVTGFRNSWYYVGTDCTTAINSAFIRKTTPKNANTTNFGTITIPAGTKRIMIAIPGNHVLKSVIDVDGQNLDVKANFTAETIAVEGANGFTATDYTVFHFENENGIAATKYTFSIS